MPRLRRVTPSAIIAIVLVGLLSGSVAAHDPTTSAASSPAAPEIASRQTGSHIAERPAFASREASDDYWLRLNMGGAQLGYGSLADIVREADLIFVGRPTDLRFYLTDEGVEGPDGNVYGEQSYMLMSVVIDELIDGDPRTEIPGHVDIIMDLPYKTAVDGWRKDLPTWETSLFVLQNLGRLNEEVDEDPDEIARTQTIYVRLNDSQGQVRELDGRAAMLPIFIVEWSPFPQDFEGKPFTDMVQAFRDASRSAGG